MNEKELFNTAVALVGSIFTYLLGAWDEPLKILLIMMAIDYLTGVIAGIINHKLDSHIGFNGILRKSTILLVLIVAVMLDRLINQGTWVCRTAMAYFYIGNEGISIIENAAKCGVPMPQKLTQIFQQLKNKGEEHV